MDSDFKFLCGPKYDLKDYFESCIDLMMDFVLPSRISKDGDTKKLAKFSEERGKPLI